jgi:hypothetical protein
MSAEATFSTGMKHRLSGLNAFKSKPSSRAEAATAPCHWTSGLARCMTAPKKVTY